MRLPILIGGLVLLGLIGGIAYIAVADISVEKQEISKTIPNERFFDVD